MKAKPKKYGVVYLDTERILNEGVSGYVVGLAEMTLDRMKALPIPILVDSGGLVVVSITPDLLSQMLYILEDLWSLQLCHFLTWVHLMDTKKAVTHKSLPAKVLDARLVLIAKRGVAHPMPAATLLASLNPWKDADEVPLFCERFTGPYLEIRNGEARKGWKVMDVHLGGELLAGVPRVYYLNEIAMSKMEEMRSVWHTHKNAQWMVGDLLIDLVKEGIKQTDVYKIAYAAIGLPKRRAFVLHKVALCYPSSSRNPKVPWTHYMKEYEKTVKVKKEQKQRLKDFHTQEVWPYVSPNLDANSTDNALNNPEQAYGDRS